MLKLRRALLSAVLATLLVPSLVLAYWPVASHSSYVSRHFRDGHYGIDIAASYGAAVLPMKFGNVRFAGWKNNCGGYQVWVSHGDGLYSAYYHLKAENVTRGQAAYGQKTVLGWVGWSGCATGAHLHMEVWRGYPWASGSYRVNPWNYIAGGTYFPTRYQ